MPGLWLLCGGLLPARLPQIERITLSSSQISVHGRGLFEQRSTLRDVWYRNSQTETAGVSLSPRHWTATRHVQVSERSCWLLSRAWIYLRAIR
ncbi:hypothetical protein CPB85DRAFT_1287942 [Mucidula mucida]|nr:hypothetical protein CPB85DRAFT_1287942 [Mucidula mucida]